MAPRSETSPATGDDQPRPAKASPAPRRTKLGWGLLDLTIMLVGVGAVALLLVGLVAPHAFRATEEAAPVQDDLKAEQQAPGVLYNRTSRVELAPLTFVTNPGADYYVKLVDPQTKSDLFGIYVRGGQRMEVRVPLGDYEMRYAMGHTWYGIPNRFGPGTAYFRAEQVFTFSKTSDGSDGYTINGNVVELILQQNGNLSTAPIGAEDF